MHHHDAPFSIPAIRDFVPEKLKPWIIILIVITFQLSGGIYMAAAAEMTGSLALLQEDILMAGYASMVGMALTFTIMFRLKFRFTSKTSLLTCSLGIIGCNLVCMHTSHVPLMVAVCFLSGVFRMWGTFECNSTIQLWITPKRDLSVFFCFIYLLVYGMIQVSGLATVYTVFFAKWEYMHLLVVGILLCQMLLVLILFRTCRTMPKLPLYGIDWLGALLWGLTVLAILFICLYGEFYEWFDSPEICTAALAALGMLALNLWRASFIRHPFIALQTWTFKPVYLTFGLYVVVDILLAPAHVLEHLYMEGMLGYDSLHAISLNWVVLAGTLSGSIFTYYAFALRKWPYRTLNLIAFSSITAYLIINYFTIDYNLPKAMLCLPLFLRGFGYIILAICFLTILSRVPFSHFFQAISVQAFVSAGFGGVLGTAVIGHLLKVISRKNYLLLSAHTDGLNPIAGLLPSGEVYGALQQQALMVSLKEIYGWLSLAGVLLVLLFLLRESDIRPQQAIHPTYRAIRKQMQKIVPAAYRE